MHDCRQTKEKLIDLVFDELQASERPGLFAEVEDCADCFGEYRLMSETLSVFNEARVAARPAESYWPKYHHALRHRMAMADDVQPEQQPSAPFWKRLFASSIPVPVPLVAVAIVLVVTTVLVMRRPAQSNPSAQSASSKATPREVIKTVEVPVYQDRIVTRTVYVDRANRTVAKNQSEPEQNLNNVVAQSSPASSKKRPGVSLEGFQPADEVKLRIIKGSYPDEK